jgi:type IV pilus assembly protein PilO
VTVTNRFGSLSIPRQLLTCGVLCVLLLIGAWRVIDPARRELAVRKARLAAETDELGKARQKATRLPALLREVRAMERVLDQRAGIGPLDTRPDEVLRNVNRLASEASLELSSFAPKASSAKTNVSEWPIQLAVEGRYHDLGRFLEGIAAMSRLMLVSDLQIKARGRPDSQTTIAATCMATIVTFDNTDVPAPAAVRSSSTGDAK